MATLKELQSGIGVSPNMQTIILDEQDMRMASRPALERLARYLGLKDVEGWQPKRLHSAVALLCNERMKP